MTPVRRPPELTIEGKKLNVLPALIDPHVHFRVPGGEHKEDWKTAALAAVRAGVTTVCEMPNNIPPCTTYERLLAKKEAIDRQLLEADIPLRYHLYFGADQEHFDQIQRVAQECKALKIFMGCSTGGLVVDSDEALDKAFRLAKEGKMIVAVHAEDEHLLKAAKKRYGPVTDPSFHSKIRPKEAAIAATQKALELCAKYDTTLYILHMSTWEELELVREAKRSGLPVFAEVTTHHLFLTEKDYTPFGTLVQMNPPLRTKEDQEALWEGIKDRTIDTIGTDHAPHTLAEKNLPFGQAPSGIPGIETLLPLLLDSVHLGKLTLQRMLELTRFTSEKLFSLPPHEDSVLVDLNLEKEVREEELSSKSKWTPYRGRTLRGWPLYTVLKGRVYSSNQGTPEGKKQLEEYLRAHPGGFFESAR
jgi:dihydroorotase